MSSSIQFPELGEILVLTGLSINRLSKITGVSRNTLTAMRDHQKVSVNSVTKLLNSVEKQLDFDVRDLRAILQRKMAPQKNNKLVANGGPTLAVDNSGGMSSVRRTSRKIAADLLDRIRICAELASELADAACAGDRNVSKDDPRQISRFHKRLNADLDEVYLQFQSMFPPASDEK